MAKYKPMRLPNGFGSITKVSGRRRKPFQAKSPTLGYRPSGTQIVKSLGYYETYNEAYERLLQYQKESLVASEGAYTFGEIFDKALAEKKESPKKPSEQTIAVYNKAYKRVPSLHRMQISEIRLKHLQSAIDNSLHLSYAVLTQIKTLYSLVYKYAMKYDLCEKDYSTFVQIRKSAPLPDKDKYYTDEERRFLIAHDDEEAAQRLLVMIYSGFRISAYNDLEVNLEEGYFRGGVKTQQSKNRVVPINSHIRQYLPLWRKVSYSKHVTLVEEFEQKYGLRHLTAHACRHTFEYLLDKAGTDDITSRMLMGHSLGDDAHDKVYSHRSFEQLQAAIESLEW